MFELAGSADTGFPSKDEAVSADSRLANGDDLLELLDGLPECETIPEDNHDPDETNNTFALREPTPPDPTDWMSDSLLMNLLSGSLPASNTKPVNFEEAFTNSAIHHDDSQAVQSANTPLTHGITQQPAVVDTAAVAIDHLYCSSAPKQAKLEPSHTPEKPAALTKYQERRKKNNISSKRSRNSRRARECNMSDQIVELERENETLKESARLLELEIQNMKQRLTVRLMATNGQH